MYIFYPGWLQIHSTLTLLYYFLKKTAVRISFGGQYTRIQMGTFRIHTLLAFPHQPYPPFIVWTVLCKCHGRRALKSPPQCGQASNSQSNIIHNVMSNLRFGRSRNLKARFIFGYGWESYIFTPGFIIFRLILSCDGLTIFVCAEKKLAEIALINCRQHT